MSKVIYVKQKYYDELKLSKFPNAGPKPSIKGMKEAFWGKNAYCLRCGQFVYCVDKETYEKAIKLDKF